MKIALFFIFLLWINQGIAQSELKFANISEFNTTEGEIIENCKIGYRTIGNLNADKSNAVLWPSWFKGTSEELIKYRILFNTIDTSGLYFILVDALTNGVSSSPSNTPDFPNLSIRDMVNAQHDLLVNHLNIDHLYVVMGISLGGITAFEWLVAYPEFMDNAISVVGSPKQSFYDILLWQIQADLIEEAIKNNQEPEFAMKRVTDIFNLNLFSPSFLVRTQSPDSVRVYMNKKYDQMPDHRDYFAGLKAIMGHDIYNRSNSNPENIKDLVKADVLVIVSKHDHIVNPKSSIDFSKTMNCQLLELESDFGHMSFFYEQEKIKSAISTFLD